MFNYFLNCLNNKYVCQHEVTKQVMYTQMNGKQDEPNQNECLKRVKTSVNYVPSSFLLTPDL